MAQKSLVLAKVLDTTVPQFGKVNSIFVVNSKFICFEYQLCQTLDFDRRYMAYHVEMPPNDQNTELMKADNLVDYMPYYIQKSGSHSYVLVKYQLKDVMELHCS